MQTMRIRSLFLNTVGALEITKRIKGACHTYAAQTVDYTKFIRRMRNRLEKLSYSDVEAPDLVRQCRLLELPYSTNFTSEVLSNSAVSSRSLKSESLK